MHLFRCLNSITIFNKFNQTKITLNRDEIVLFNSRPHLFKTLPHGPLLTHNCGGDTRRYRLRRRLLPSARRVDRSIVRGLPPSQIHSIPRGQVQTLPTTLLNQR